MLNITGAIGAALLAFSALSFLGLGVQPPFYDWGRMLNEGLGRIYINPAGALAPGVAIVIAGVTFNLLGEGLAQVAAAGDAAVPWCGVDAARPPRARSRRPSTITTPVLAVSGLSVTFPTPDGDVLAVRDVSLTVRRGEIVGIVGESGSGKSVTALAIAQLVSYPGEVTVAQLRFDGRDLADLRPGERRRLLGDVVADGVPEPGHDAQPGPARRPSARRGVRGSRRHEPRRGDAASRRQARSGRHRRTRAAAARLPPRAVRRHEAAGRDRHGADGPARSSSSPTNRRPPSTSPCSARSSTCCSR